MRLLNLEGYSPAPIEESELRMEDRWILSRLSTVSEQLTTLLGRYQFDAATRALRDFTWNEFCDWYLEMIKPRLRDEADRPAAQRVLVGVMDALLRMLQPFTPFITEELWQRLNEIAPERGLLKPEPGRGERDDRPLAGTSRKIGRMNRWNRGSSDCRIRSSPCGTCGRFTTSAPTTPLTLYVRCPETVAADLNEVADQFDNLAKTVLKAAGAEVQRPPASANFALTDADGFIPLEGVIDIREEIERLEKEAEKLRGFIKGHEKKLANENFVQKAPEHVVERCPRDAGEPQEPTGEHRGDPPPTARDR